MVAQHSVDVGDNAGAAHVIVHLSDFGRDCDYRFGRADALFVGIDLKVVVTTGPITRELCNPTYTAILMV